jgi:hypothetical protein
MPRNNADFHKERTQDRSKNENLNVKLRNPAYGKVEGKFDSDGNTDSMRERNDMRDRQDIAEANRGDTTPPIKIKG